MWHCIILSSKGKIEVKTNNENFWSQIISFEKLRFIMWIKENSVLEVSDFSKLDYKISLVDCGETMYCLNVASTQCT